MIWIEGFFTSLQSFVADFSPLNSCSFAPSFLRHPTFHRYRRNANSAKIEIPSYLQPTWGIRGESCDSVCARFDQRCSVGDFSVINRFVFY